MGQRGPLPEPTELKKLKGNPGKRPLPTDEPEPMLAPAVPDAPGWLNARASLVWIRIATELHAAKMLATLDLSILEAFCVAYDQWRQMLEAIEQEGYTYRAYDDHGNLKYAAQTPEAVLASKFAADVNKFAKVLGLGPAYRVGLRIVGPDGADSKTTDPIAEQLSGKNAGDINPPPPRKPATKTPPKSHSKATKKAPAKRATKKATQKPSTPPTKRSEAK